MTHIEVPCGSCRACCKQDRIVLHGMVDDPTKYRWHLEPAYNPAVAVWGGGLAVRVLDRKPNGECTYLGDGGCEIHDDSPIACQSFDCRDYVQKRTPREQRIMIQRNPSTRAVFEAGKQRLEAA